MSRVSDDLVAREEEYLRLNAEIEQKTRMLVEEVENLSHEQELPADISATKYVPDITSIEQTPENLFHNVQVPSITKKISHSLPNDDVLPVEAKDLGTEATVRLLKAKVRVLEEEVEGLTIENNKQKQILSRTKQTLASEKEEKSKLQKSIQNLQSQLEKFVNLADDKKAQNKILETDLVNLQKDYEALERTEKKSGQTQKTLELRLDRAVEEIEKYKNLLSAERAKVSENSNFDKETFSNMSNENKVLQKQKSELINAYKKQMKLIDVLRKQKLHLEASRMLNFTQEEFMKVLDWKNA